MKKSLLWTLLYGTALASFTTYVVLDTFVLSRSYQTNATEMNTAMFSESATASTEVVTNSDSAVLTEQVTTTTTLVAETNSDDTAWESENDSPHHKPSFDFERDSHANDTESADTEDASTTAMTTTTTTESSDATTTNSATSYQDDNVTITLTEYYENNTKIYVADVQVQSAQSLKTAFAEDTYGKNVVETTSSIAAAHNAILAINGDYYGAQESGYVIRNGIVYRDTASDADVLCIYADGSMSIQNPSEKTADELVAEGVWQAFSFGPALLENGTISVTQGEEVGKAMASNPRTAIGLIDTNHYVFVVADGRTSESEGLSLYELASFMQTLGVQNAYNLDGGGSSTMYFQGSVVNNPTTNGNHIQEREVSDIVYIG